MHSQPPIKVKLVLPPKEASVTSKEAVIERTDSSKLYLNCVNTLDFTLT